ncbi:VOC family protein [Erythrobacter gaetbuli]|uniref:VOC family protein n=1 Tax=Qipengyuania gaetbuli TaxID=266952 RepID=A0A844XWM6_9SPHN|nr:VOC family protein [Qipengyuania gaetbuli]MXO49984.1 VOC family protein [Qipengyuania gaetbuli]
MAKITGLGGVFYVVDDPEATRAWYRDTLGIDGDYGPMLRWSEETCEQPYSLISHFKDDSYLKPGSASFMINLRVDDLDGFVAQLRAKGVDVLDEVDEGYGKFAWLLDPNGVKIELWQQLAAPE